ncbi:tetratricopeptide repeat protein [Alteribacillus sp. HJP-4]|uniref:tetratricopeptide repeat protein n=1 Tax=Alteribacillus sp. HJP-4 TaxID=2775394 RepID=UPI0035CCEF0B
MNNRIQEGLTLLQKGDTENGLEQLALAEKDASHQEKYDLILLYQEMGRADKAKPLLEELIRLYPDEGELYVMIAETSIDLDQEDDAIEWLLEVSGEDNVYLQAQMLLADLYQLQGLDEAAEDKLRKALEIAPEEPVLLAGLADFYLERGDFSKSIPYLKQAERLGFTFPEGSLDLRLAEAYSATGEFEDALRHYEIGLKEKKETQAMFGYGFTALQLNEYKLAAEQLEALKSMDPEFVTLYPYLVRAYEGAQMHEEALKAAEEGLSVDEFNDGLFTEAGKLSLSLGDEISAERRLKEALALNPANSEAGLSLLAMWDRQEDFDSIIELASHLSELGEEDPRLTWYQGRAYFETEKDKKAMECYEKAYTSYQEDPEFLEEFGRLLLEAGQRGKAEAVLKEALMLDPSNQEITYLLEELESRG